MEDNEPLIFYLSNDDNTIDEDEYNRVVKSVNVNADTTLIDLNENPFGFFNYLKICKRKSNMEKISTVGVYRPTIKPVRYYNLLSFRIYLCELVYNAINLFPEICEYTITSRNEKGTSSLRFGYFKDIVKGESEPSMGIFKSNFDGECFYLRLHDIKSMYMANRHKEIDEMSVTAVIVSMYMCGTTPKITVDYKINPGYFKGKLKFK
jgi:hypothetical protein